MQAAGVVALRMPTDRCCHRICSGACAAWTRTDPVPHARLLNKQLFMQILFQGPHVKMGVYRGRPTGVSPHVTTGRADYFGPFVNRYA